MLLKQVTLSALAKGTGITVFRRWKISRVRAGSTFRTAVGVVAVGSIQSTRLDAITERAARSGGFASRAALLDELARHPGGQLYRITLRLEGPDPRIALRGRSRITAAERKELEARLARLGARAADGPWALPLLRLIEAHPAVRAPDLARDIGMKTPRFKARVRQLKDLGLTESLEVGYRLSPRGRALLRGMRD